MIICGYAGIGKSWLAHNIKNVMDLESTPFEKDWVRYAKCAAHYSANGFIVLVSCHQELRDALRDICLRNSLSSRFEFGTEKLYNFTTILPDAADKEIYRKIYESRGNTQQFIDVQMNHWEEWINPNSIGFEFVRHLAPGGERLYDYMKRMNADRKGMCSFCGYDSCLSQDPIKTKCGKPFNID
jgi:hypothetical protein